MHRIEQRIFLFQSYFKKIIIITFGVFFLIKIFHIIGYYYLVMTLSSFFFSFFWESSNDLTSSAMRCYDLLNDSYDALGLHCAWLELERRLCLGGEWLMSLSGIGNYWKWLTRSNLGLYNFIVFQSCNL